MVIPALVFGRDDRTILRKILTLMVQHIIIRSTGTVMCKLEYELGSAASDDTLDSFGDGIFPLR